MSAFAIGAAATAWDGVWTALVTPFDASGAIDWPAFESLVRAQIAAGVAGVRDRAALDPPAAPLSAAEEAAFRRRRGYPWVCPPAGARLPQSAEAALDALRRGDVRIVLSDCFPAALWKLIVAARQADAAAAAQIAAGPGGLEALRAAYNRVYS